MDRGSGLSDGYVLELARYMLARARLLRHLLVSGGAASLAGIVSMMYLRLFFASAFDHEFNLWLGLTALHCLFVFAIVAVWFRGAVRATPPPGTASVIGAAVLGTGAAFLVPYGWILVITGQAILTSGLAVAISYYVGLGRRPEFLRVRVDDSGLGLIPRVIGTAVASAVGSFGTVTLLWNIQPWDARIKSVWLPATVRHCILLFFVLWLWFSVFRPSIKTVRGLLSGFGAAAVGSLSAFLLGMRPMQQGFILIYSGHAFLASLAAAVTYISLATLHTTRIEGHNRFH